jgi:ribosomal protein L7/L12
MPMTADNLPADVIEAVNRGHLIEAIKRLRQQRNLGLKEAKDLVDQYRLGVISAPNPATGTDELPEDVRAALARGQKIEAIRLLRDHTGLGMKDARDRVDAHEPPPTGNPPATIRDGSAAPAQGLWWFLALAAVAAAAYVLLRAPGAEAPL